MVVHNNININNKKMKMPNARCNKQFYFNVCTINIGLDSRQLIIIVVTNNYLPTVDNSTTMNTCGKL